MHWIRWTKKEKKELRRQFKNSIPIEKIRVGNRTPAAIKYQIYRLKLYMHKWRKSEIIFLKKAVQEGKTPEEIRLPGRTEIAIRNKLIRSGIWKTKKRRTRAWNIKEIRKLKHLVLNCGYTAKMLVSNEYFPRRSYDSISQQMRRSRVKRGF